MSDPLALVPFAVAAGGGQLGGVPASQLVAAGVTLLQRAAPLVRALAGRRSAVLLPPTTPSNTPTGAWLVALAASDGRGMVMLAPPANGRGLDALCEMHHIGALFTTRHTLAAWQTDVPPTMPVVLLDDAPFSARVQSADGTLDRCIDLGTHFGIPVEGDPAVDGADEECLVMVDGETAHVLTHRAVLLAARTRPSAPLDVAHGASAHAASSRLTAFIAELSTLLTGGHVSGASALPM